MELSDVVSGFLREKPEMLHMLTIDFKILISDSKKIGFLI